MFTAPTMAEIDAAAARLNGRIVPTPTLELSCGKMAAMLPQGASVSMKMELFQNAGSFKIRGVLLGVDGMTADDRRVGVVAASAGNHALAVSTAAQAEGIDARIVMPDFADPIRVQGCRDMGARVDLFPSMGALFAAMEHIAKKDGRYMLHAYEAPHMTLGAATCGAEFARAVDGFDLVVVPVGGGGFISGMSTAIKHLHPDATIYAVEPFGADSLFQSLKNGKATALEKVDTIADSLGAPEALPNSFAIARQNIKGVVRVEDSEIVDAMRLMNDTLKIMPEPACAASLAAILGPLRAESAGRRVGIVACGSNISVARFSAILGC